MSEGIFVGCGRERLTNRREFSINLTGRYAINIDLNEPLYRPNRFFEQMLDDLVQPIRFEASGDLQDGIECIVIDRRRGLGGSKAAARIRAARNVLHSSAQLSKRLHIRRNFFIHPEFTVWRNHPMNGLKELCDIRRSSRYFRS